MEWIGCNPMQLLPFASKQDPLYNQALLTLSVKCLANDQTCNVVTISEVGK